MTFLIVTIAIAAGGAGYGAVTAARRERNAFARVVSSNYALVFAGFVLAVMVVQARGFPDAHSSGLALPGYAMAIFIVAANLAILVIDMRKDHNEIKNDKSSQ